MTVHKRTRNHMIHFLHRYSFCVNIHPTHNIMDAEVFVKKICQEYLDKNNCYLRPGEIFTILNGNYYYNGHLVFCITDDNVFFIGEYWADIAVELTDLIQQKTVTIATTWYQNSQKILLNSCALKVNLFDYDMNKIVKTTHKCNVLTRLYIVLCEKVGPDVARLLVEKMYYQ